MGLNNDPDIMASMALDGWGAMLMMLALLCARPRDRGDVLGS